jgi:hypothetical protein
MRCPFCLNRGGEPIAESQRVVCRVCGQYIANLRVADAPKVIKFLVVLEPTDPAHSIHALRHFLKGAMRNFGLRCIDLKEISDDPTNKQSRDRDTIDGSGGKWIAPSAVWK